MSVGNTGDLRLPLIRHSGTLFLIRFFPVAAMAVVGIAFSRRLPVALNGAYQQVWVYLAVFVTIAALGMPPLMLTHTGAAITGWLKKVTNRHLGVYFLWVILLAFILFATLLYKNHFAAWVAPALFIVQLVFLLQETYLIIHRKFRIAMVASLLYGLGFCLVHFLALRGLISLWTTLWLVTVLGCFRILLLSIIASRVYRFTTESVAAPISTLIKRQWLQIGIYDVAQIAFRYVDKFAISMLVGPALFAVYFIGTTDVPFMAMMLGAVGNSLLQQMAQGDNTHSSKVKLLNTSGALLARIVFPVFFFLLFFSKEFIVFVFSEKYTAAVPLFAISVLALPLRAYNYTSLLQHLNRVKLINIGAVLDLCIACGLAAPLYLWKGLPGVAFAFMISTYLQAGFYLFHSSKAVQQPFWKLIPWKQWLALLLVYGILIFGLQRLLQEHFALREILFLGAAATVIIIVVSLLPIFFSRKK